MKEEQYGAIDIFESDNLDINHAKATVAVVGYSDKKNPSSKIMSLHSDGKSYTDCMSRKRKALT